MGDDFNCKSSFLQQSCTLEMVQAVIIYERLSVRTTHTKKKEKGHGSDLVPIYRT